jgi:hypothetical protein
MMPNATHPALLPLLKRASEGDSDTALESVLAFVANRPVRSWSDTDLERFTPQAKAVGELFQRERSRRSPAAALSTHQQQRCREIAARLKNVLQTEISTNPQELQAALRLLADELIRQDS